MHRFEQEKRLFMKDCRVWGIGLLVVFVAPASWAQSSAVLDTVRAGRFDNGKMWTFEHPPLGYWEDAYHFQPDRDWLEQARLGALRIPGCSASFVSPNGLVMTNHHCIRSFLTDASREGEDLLDSGFYATSLETERPAEDLYADQLIDIVDVTDEVEIALDTVQTSIDEADALASILEDVAAKISEAYVDEETSIEVEVISLYYGGQYSAYVFRRYEDVRLVFAPELQMGHYGGDADNFTYPRYSLDMSFVRVYDDGEPLQNEHYFEWSTTGTRAGELVFVVGSPGSTSRLETVSQLEFRRDIEDRFLLAFVDRRLEAMQAFYDANPESEEAETILPDILSLQNAQKLYQGRLRALNNPIIMAKRRDNERRFTEAIASDSALQAEFGTLTQDMVNVLDEQRQREAQIGAFLSLGNEEYGSLLLNRAIQALIYIAQQQQGAPEEAVIELRNTLLAVPDRPSALEEKLLAARFADFQTYLGVEHEVVQALLQGRTPEAAAVDILAQTSLADSASTAQVVEAGSLSIGDPAIQMVFAFVQVYAAFEGEMVALDGRKQALARQLGRAWFAAYGTTIPPDATFSLRIADGVVKGYSYNGTEAPPFTSFYGMYDHYHAYGDESDWALPERWQNPAPAFDLTTPLNLVTTADIIGGNSGSPLLNKNLEVVGLVFDGNIESLSGDYIYGAPGARSVAVDARGILETLDDIYDADRIVVELRLGEMPATEEEADALMSSEMRERDEDGSR